MTRTFYHRDIKIMQAFRQNTRGTGMTRQGSMPVLRQGFSKLWRVLGVLLLSCAVPMAFASGSSLSVSISEAPANLIQKVKSLLPQPQEMQVQSHVELPEYAHVIAADFSSGDARYLAVTTVVGEQQSLSEIHLWEVGSASLTQTLHMPAGSSTLSMAGGLRWSPDGQTLATCAGRSWDGTVVQAWVGRVNYMRPAYAVQAGGSGRCTALAFSSAGKELLVVEDRDAGERAAGGERRQALFAGGIVF